MAKIAIDITPTKDLNQYRGVGVYTKNLITKIQELDKGNEYIFFTRGEKLPKVDLIHYPYFDFFFNTLPIFKKTRTIVTIHDVIPLVFPKDFPKGIKGFLKFQIQSFSLKNTSTIITDSNQSKNDIAKFLKIPKAKINIVHLAANSIFRPQPKSVINKVIEKYKLPSIFVLYVGDVNYNKNLQKLIEAVNKGGFNLVLVGSALVDEYLSETKKIIVEIKRLGISNKVWRLGLIPENDLVAIYNAAKVYIQPSIYEGFGLPIVEAMACGTIVACSDIYVHHEIAGDAAFYFNPQETDEIVEVLNKIIKLNPAATKVRREKNILQSNKFSWKMTVQETIKIYKKVLLS